MKTNRLKFVLLVLILTISAVGMAQTSKDYSKNLYSIVTPYEKAHAKLVENATQKMSKFNNSNNLVDAYYFDRVVNPKGSDSFFSGTEMMILEEKMDAILSWTLVASNPQSPKAAFVKWYNSELNRIEKLKTDIDIERILMRNPPSGTMYKLKKSVAINLRLWAEQGEFESTKKYQERLSNKSTWAFDSITSTLATNICSRAYVKFDRYDADQELVYLMLCRKKDDGSVVKLPFSIPMEPSRAEVAVPYMREYDFKIERYIGGIGIHDGYLFPLQSSYSYSNGYSGRDTVETHFNLPKVVLSYDDLYMGDTVLDRYLKGHKCQILSYEEWLSSQEDQDPHYQQWGKYFETRDDYRRSVDHYGKGEGFEFELLYPRYENKVRSRSLFELVYRSGGLEEVEKLISIKNTIKMYAPYYYKLSHTERLELAYRRGGLTEIEKIKSLDDTIELYVKEYRNKSDWDWERKEDNFRGSVWSEYDEKGLSGAMEKLRQYKTNYYQRLQIEEQKRELTDTINLYWNRYRNTSDRNWNGPKFSDSIWAEYNKNGLSGAMEILHQFKADYYQRLQIEEQKRIEYEAQLKAVEQERLKQEKKDRRRKRFSTLGTLLLLGGSGAAALIFMQSEE